MDSKKQLSEQDVRTKYITPAIKRAGWDEITQLREEVYFTKGRMEVKDNNHSLGSGMQQAMDYAETLDVPFAYSSNGDGFLEHDFLTGKERQLSMNELPSPESLYDRYKNARKINATSEKVLTTPYYADSTGIDAEARACSTGAEEKLF
jgi:type I restriction enzyme, R subunit